MMKQNKKVTHRFCLFLSRGVTILMIKENTCTISAGFFMFIEASNPRKLNDTAVLQSKIFLPSGERCLQFYYHMYGEDMGAMHVLYSSDAGDKKIWEKQKDQGNQWHLAHVQLSSAKSPYRVRYLSPLGLLWKARSICNVKLCYEPERPSARVPLSFRGLKLLGVLYFLKWFFFQ